MIKNKQTNYGSLYENDLQEEWTRYQKAEGYFLKAKRVELFLKAYQSNDI